MCGPINDGKQKAAREKFAEELSSALSETLCSPSGILSLPGSSSIFDGEKKEISAPDHPRFWQIGNRGNKNRRLKH
jgi:hypothetical protein